ncbi:MAG: acyl-CoA dehydratase activase [Actinobacteria bacterium]|nr:acyl-CoA dehydratase activase [Actinomycetota bacterium]
MVVAGVDVGAATAKAVILRDGGIAGFAVLPTGHDIQKIARKVTRLALAKAELTMADLHYTVGTGYGRRAIPFADEAITEITCHARGANWVIPETRTIIDIGGQDSKAIRLDARGNVLNFVMNDKCAAGTGRFFEVMAKVLQLPLDKFASPELLGQHPWKISSVCTVFAESEVVSLRAEKKSREDIIAGLYQAVASRVGAMARTIDYEDLVVFTGGVAKNKAMARALEEEIGHKIVCPDEPQIMGALGAALFALKKV